jgi:hypothetical protein
MVKEGQDLFVFEKSKDFFLLSHYGLLIPLAGKFYDITDYLIE